MHASDKGWATKPTETDEFVQFVRTSSPGLLHTAWLLCGDAHRAEEMVQESFERVYLKWGRVTKDGQPLAYTRRVLINLNTDRWRRTRKESLTSDGELRDAATPRGSCVEDRDLVVRLLRLLPQREREVVVLRHYADLSEHDVAELLGVSVGTVKSSASRGLATLRAAMTQDDKTRNEESRS